MSRAIPLVTCACVALFAHAVEAADAPPLVLETKIELPGVRGRIDHLAIDVEKQRLFVAALGNDTVEVVDVAAGRHFRTIKGLAEPQGIAVVPALDRFAVANGRDGTLRVFDATSLAPVRSFQIGDDADNVRLDPATGALWVGYGSGALKAVDLEHGATTDVPVGGHPESFQLEKSGTRLFVNVPDARKVAVVDRGKGTVIGSWNTGHAAANFPMALDEDGKRLLVVCRNPPRLLVLDSESGKLQSELATVGDADDVFYDKAGRRVYVSGGAGALVVYGRQGTAGLQETARLSTVPGARTSLFVPELRRLFLAVRQTGSTPAAVWVYRVGH